MHNIRETNGRFYNRYGQRISKSVALMLMDCDRAILEMIKNEKTG